MIAAKISGIATSRGGGRGAAGTSERRRAVVARRRLEEASGSPVTVIASPTFADGSSARRSTRQFAPESSVMK